MFLKLSYDSLLYMCNTKIYNIKIYLFDYIRKNCHRHCEFIRKIQPIKKIYNLVPRAGTIHVMMFSS